MHGYTHQVRMYRPETSRRAEPGTEGDMKISPSLQELTGERGEISLPGKTLTLRACPSPTQLPQGRVRNPHLS